MEARVAAVAAAIGNSNTPRISRHHEGMQTMSRSEPELDQPTSSPNDEERPNAESASVGQFNLTQDGPNPPSILDQMELHPVHEENSKAFGFGHSKDHNHPKGKKLWKIRSMFGRENGAEEKSRFQKKHHSDSIDDFRQRFSDAGSLDGSLHNSRFSRNESYEELNENHTAHASSRKSQTTNGSKKMLMRSTKILRKYTTDSVSRRNVNQEHQEHPDTQNTASSWRINGLSEDWQREFYGLPPLNKNHPNSRSQGNLTSRSEDQSSYRSKETGSEQGDSLSHYGRSTLKKKGKLPLIHPYSRARRDMNILLAVCLLYIAIVLPYEFCFSVHVLGYWLFADAFVTVVFLLDVCITMRTGFIQKGKREVKEGLRILKPATIVMEPRAIAIRYLKGWFTVDFISSMPWDFLLYVHPVERRYWVLQILRSLRILRIHRLSIVRSELRETWSAGQRQFLEICGLFCLTLYFAHFSACLFVAVGKLQSSPQRWIDQTHYNDDGQAGVLSEGPQIDLYIASLYFQIVSLATVGYGDIHAGLTVPDRLFMTFINIFGALLLAYIVGKISTLIIEKRRRRYAMRERFATLHAYIAREELPEWLSTRLMVHLSRQWASQIIEFSEVELVKDMTEELQSELLIQWWRKCIPSSALLPHKHGFLGALLGKCKTQVYPVRDTITRESETVRQLWILRSGQLAVSRSVAMDDLDVSGGVSDQESEEEEEEEPPADEKDADARQLQKLASYKRPDQRALNKVPTTNWAVDLDRGDQSNKALVTEMAAEGTIIGEAPLLLGLTHRVIKERAARHNEKGVKRKKKLAIKTIVQDVTVECKSECTVLVLLLDDIFEVLDQFPSLTHKLKRAVLRAERHIQKAAAKAGNDEGKTV